METINNFIALGIEPKGNRRQQKVHCPNCAKVGKTNLRDTPLSINLNDGLYNCHKCGWSGCVIEKKEFKPEPIMTYKLPQKLNITNLTDEALKYFEGRGISQEIINNNKIASSKDGNSIVFPYFKNATLVNYKTRLLKEKRFFQAKDAEPIMYNYDRIQGQKEIIVCEGEIDALSWEVAGFTNHTSVNQGAPNENDNNVDKKLECITNCFETFEQAEVIYLSVDNDPNGKRLEKELIRRFGAEKCKLIDFDDCKDANEYLKKHSAFDLAQLLKQAKDVKIDGVFTVNDVFKSMLYSFENGQQRGETTYVDCVDLAWKWRKSEVNMWTGYQNEGKSLFLNQLSVIKAVMDGDKFAVFSPENMPLDEFFNDLIEMYVGKSTDPYYKDFQMSKAEYLEASTFINKHFFLVYPENDFKLDTIFEKTKYLIRKQGIEHLIIDPYNTIEHFIKAGEREDLYISRFMGMLKRFAVEQNISIHLIAHQITQRPNDKDGGRLPKPMLNSIKGGGTFADKADNVLFVWRPNRLVDFRDPMVVFGSQKIKKQKLVARPCDVHDIEFNWKENRYYKENVSFFKAVDNKKFGKKEDKETPQIQGTLTDAFPQLYEDENDCPF